MRPPQDVVAPASILKRLTLHFADSGTERSYRGYAQRESLPDLRFGLILAVLLYAAFGVLDFWVTPDHLVATLSLRAVVVLVSTVVLLASFGRVFVRLGQVIMTMTSAIIGTGIVAMLAFVGPEAADRYYVGLILVVIASHAMFGLRFPYATLACAITVAGFLFVEIALLVRPGYVVFNNTMFLASAWIISGYGGYASERSHRLAFVRQRQIDAQRRQSEHDSLHDALTGLPNRRLLVERLEHACQRARRHQERVGVLFIDLDGFKHVNDTHGHAAGDALLSEVARRLAGAVREVDTVARLGGDEFVVLLDEIHDRADAEAFTRRLAGCFQAPIDLDGERVHIGHSIGMSVYPDDARTPLELLSFADQGMYESKRRARD